MADRAQCELPQITCSKYRISRINRMVPRPPLGAYPQFLLCGQVGSAPIRIRMMMIRRILITL